MQDPLDRRLEQAERDIKDTEGKLGQLSSLPGLVEDLKSQNNRIFGVLDETKDLIRDVRIELAKKCDAGDCSNKHKDILSVAKETAQISVKKNGNGTTGKLLDIIKLLVTALGGAIIALFGKQVIK